MVYSIFFLKPSALLGWGERKKHPELFSTPHEVLRTDSPCNAYWSTSLPTQTRSGRDKPSRMKLMLNKNVQTRTHTTWPPLHYFEVRKDKRHALLPSSPQKWNWNGFWSATWPKKDYVDYGRTQLYFSHKSPKPASDFVPANFIRFCQATSAPPKISTKNEWELPLTTSTRGNACVPSCSTFISGSHSTLARQPLVGNSPQPVG